jgi:hypothetical protein
MGQDAWLGLLPGLLLVVGVILIYKGGSGWYIFRRSIYKEIYSNYLEYAMRKKSMAKLSESYFLESRLGKHKICYQLASVRGEKIPQAYVVLILSSGIYLLDIKRQTGDIEANIRGDFKYEEVITGKKKEKPRIEIKMMKNPMDEVRYFQKKIFQKLHGEKVTAFPIVVFPDSSTLTWKEEEKEIPVIHRKDVYSTVKILHDSHPQILSEEEIEKIYLAMASEVLEAERNEKNGLRKNEV